MQARAAASRSDWAISGAFFFSIILIFVYYRKAFFRKYS
jgi:hypothetical protein